MKTIKYLVTAVLLSGSFWSCTNEWDTHYGADSEVVNNDQVSVVNSSAVDYLKSETDLSNMYTLFQETGLIDQMNGKEQLFTILVVENSAATRAEADEERVYLAKSHISDASLSPSNLTDGQRVLMWNGKYINVKKEIEAGVETIYFQNSKVTKITKVNNGYIYTIDQYVDSPRSMYELIESLGDDYSIFRNMIVSRNERTFDKAASLPIGVDNTGSTVYDSIFVITNPYFKAQGFDLMSESLTATMLIPSNAVIEQALSDARASLNEWGLTRVDSIMENWIFQSAFFNKKYVKQDFADNEDLTSIFSKQWRTTIQKVDLDEPVSMSNGVAYYINSMKIPTNVLIYRLKDYMKYYELLNETEKASYFDATNLTYSKTATEVTAWSGWPAAGFPYIENRVVYFNLTDNALKEFTLNFVPFHYKDLTAGSHETTPYLIPPGEYDLCLGFKQKLGHDVAVAFNGEYINTITASELTSTTYHYDRGGQGYPEGYDTSKATDSKKTNYDRDGGKVGVVTITGTEAVPVTITLSCPNMDTKTSTLFHHWCLKPTKNCY